MAKQESWGYGGMVDAEDLKSFDHCDRVGSSPTIPTNQIQLFPILNKFLNLFKLLKFVLFCAANTVAICTSIIKEISIGSMFFNVFIIFINLVEVFFGGCGRTRTADPYDVNVVL